MHMSSTPGSQQRSRQIETRQFTRQNHQDTTTKKPNKNVPCRWPESSWRHMVLQMNVRRLAGFVGQFDQSPLGSRRYRLVR